VRGSRKVLARLQSRQDRLDSSGAYWNKRSNKSAAAPSSTSSPRK
jgi:hypothetical protein